MRLSQPPLRSPPSLGFEPSQAIISPEPIQLSQLAATTPQLSLSLAQPRLGLLGAQIEAGAPKGVDLSLDNIDMRRNAAENSDVDFWGRCLLPSQTKPGSFVEEFWSSLLGRGAVSSAFSEDGKYLLKDIFHSNLSDRRAEGDRFVPPSTSYSHVQKLIDLTTHEFDFRQRRIDEFLSATFSRNAPSKEFPRSWASSVRVVNSQKPLKNGQLRACADHKISVSTLKAIAPVFDNRTEDGTRFRIYTLGTLEVRTLQEYDGVEVIGAVFSHRAPSRQSINQAIRTWGSKEDARIAKIILYVEKNDGTLGYYVALETDEGDIVATELPPSGAAIWDWNPGHLEERSSLAKVLNVLDCCSMQMNVSIADVMDACSSSFKHASQRNSTSTRKKYARFVYACVEEKA